jgi:uroporphyrinogen decarboxylase
VNITPQSDKRLLRALAGERLDTPPVWLMRQAGRYLPEYRALRARSGSFLELCLTPALAAEVTLQPIRRFGFDAAILFADILVVPYGLTQPVTFREGEGPVLDRLVATADLQRLNRSAFRERVAPVGETVRLVRRALSDDVALIGFAGSPWTVATYMIEGGSSRDFGRVKGWLYRDPAGFTALIDILVDATIEYLGWQVEMGAEIVQLFESWAGALSAPAFERWVIEPNARILAGLRNRHPAVPVILFPRGAGANYLAVSETIGTVGLGLDTTVPLDWACRVLQPRHTLQGNLDPQVLAVGGDALATEVARIRNALGSGPFIFNLGHGVLPETPPEHVAELVRLVRA